MEATTSKVIGSAVRDSPGLPLLNGRVIRILHWSVVFGCCAMFGCQGNSPTVHFVLPQGFRGAFIIQTDRADGVVLKERNSVYVCSIPSSGILKVKGKKPFDDWKRLNASFENGDVIPIAWEPEKIGPNAVALWIGGAGTVEDGVIYYFIATKEEVEQLKRETAAAPVRPGGVKNKN